MTSLLHYGADSVLEVAGAHVRNVGASVDIRSLSADAAAAATSAALHQPIGFPPLRQATVPGDHVTVALEPGLPAADAICAAIVQELLAAGVQPGDITILRAPADVDAGAPDPRSALPSDQAAAVQLVVHHPDVRGELTYLGPLTGEQGIYLNRALGDADLVVPVGCRRAVDAADHATPDGLYPAFADAKTQSRFLSWELPDSGGHAADGRREASEALRLLGAPFRVVVVPGAQGGVHAILAGEADAVVREAGEQYHSLWRRESREKAALVVAGLSGPSWQQTWDNVGRAAAAASRLVAENGAIAICCDLAAPPGTALVRSAASDQPFTMLRRLRKQPPADLLTALRIARVRESARIYLLSGLDESTVEELGLAAAASPGDILRVISRSPDCILLPDAQFAFVDADVGAGA